MKPSERIYQVARGYAEREGELIRRPTENYWLRAALDYLDEQTAEIAELKRRLDVQQEIEQGDDA